jgi:hypothetical protein
MEADLGLTRNWIAKKMPFMIEDIRAALGKAVRAKATEQEIERLVVDLAEWIIPMAAFRGSSLWRREGYQPRDIALIALAGLFGRDSQGRFPGLAKAFPDHPGGPLNSSPAEFERYLRVVLSRRLQETLFALSGETQPGRLKLRREILYSCSRGGIRKAERTREGLILRIEKGDGVSPCLPRETLLEAAILGRLWGLNVPAFIRGLHNCLPEKDRSHPWRLTDVVSVHVQLHFQTSFRPTIPLVQLDNQADHDDRALFPRVLDEAAVFLEAKIYAYVQRGRIQPDRAAPLRRAVLRILETRWEGGSNESYADLLRREGWDVPNDRYRAETRKIVEYLVRAAKRHLSEVYGLARPSAHRRFESHTHLPARGARRT